MMWANLNTIPTWTLLIFCFLITYRINKNRLLTLNAVLNNVFFWRSRHGLWRAVWAANRSTQLQGGNIVRPQLRAAASRHRHIIEVRSEDVRKRIGQAKLVSRVVYKAALNRGLQLLSLSFSAPLSFPYPLQSLIVDSRWAVKHYINWRLNIRAAIG